MEYTIYSRIAGTTKYLLCKCKIFEKATFVNSRPPMKTLASFLEEESKIEEGRLWREKRDSYYGKFS